MTGSTWKIIPQVYIFYTSNMQINGNIIQAVMCGNQII